MSLFEMTVAGGSLILIITVIRALAINRLPKRTFLILWGVALLRLLIPVSVPFKLSIFSMAARASAMEDAPVVAERNKGVILAAKQAALTVQDAPSQDVSVWHILWLAGMTAALLFFGIAYIRHLRAFRAAVPVENSFTRAWLAGHPLRRPVAVRESDSIAAPLTYGIFRPVILMPVGVDWEDAGTLNCVFTHEYVHIRRFDALLRLALTAALCVHWLNPLVWVMYLLALRDIELSCDEAVVRQFGLENRRAYALALLAMEETRRHFNAFVSGFSKNASEERIRAIMKAKKPTARCRAVSVFLVACACASFCISVAAAEDPGLRETPGLVTISLEERRQDCRGWRSGRYLCPTLEGSFIKLQITGKGGETVGMFLHTEESDEARGAWIPLDGKIYELWFQVPEGGVYHLATFPERDDYDEYYAYIQTRYSVYFANGEPISEHRRDLYDGWHTEEVSINVTAPFVQQNASHASAVGHSNFELALSD